MKRLCNEAKRFRDCSEKYVKGKKDDLCKMGKKKENPTTHNSPEGFDYEAFEAQAIAGLQIGAGLIDTRGVLNSA